MKTVCVREPDATLASVHTDLNTIKDRLTEATKTATPTTALSISEAQRHILRAIQAIERAQEDVAWKEIADDLITQAQEERETSQ